MNIYDKCECCKNIVYDYQTETKINQYYILMDNEMHETILCEDCIEPYIMDQVRKIRNKKYSNNICQRRNEQKNNLHQKK